MSFVLGLTGGIGSGKSAASDWFATQGIVVVDADVVAREIVVLGEPVLAQIHAFFGDWVLQANGELNRNALREHIFNDPQARLALEHITHPAIRERIIKQLTQANSPYSILVSPLLFETHQHELTDHVLLIDASPTLQIQRATQRDGQSTVQIEKIMTAQMSRAEKIQRADDVIVNDGDLAHLYAQLETYHQAYLSRCCESD